MIKGTHDERRELFVRSADYLRFLIDKIDDVDEKSEFSNLIYAKIEPYLKNKHKLEIENLNNDPEERFKKGQSTLDAFRSLFQKYKYKH
jgi:hypothetical protein